MTDQTAEAVERLKAAAIKCAAAHADGHSLRLFEPGAFGADLTTLLADRERLRVALEEVRLTQHLGIAWGIAEAALNTQGEG